MKKRILIRVLLLSLFCVLSVFGAGTAAVRYHRTATLRARLETAAELAAAADPSAFPALSGADGLRLQLLGQDGTVRSDSAPGEPADTGPAGLVSRARAGEPAFERYYSAVLGGWAAAYATPVAGGETVLLLTLPDRETDTFYRIATPLLLGALLLSVGLSVLVSWRMSRAFSDRVEDVADSLRSLGAAMMEAQSRERVKLAAVLDIVAQGILALDSAFRVVLANRSAMKLFGGGEHAVGESLFCLLDDDELCRRIYEYGGALRGGFHCRASPVAGGIYAADRPAAGCRQGRRGVDGKDRGDALVRDRPGRGAVGAGLFVRSKPDAASLRRGPGQPAAWIGLRLFPPSDHRFPPSGLAGNLRTPPASADCKDRERFISLSFM